MSDASAVSRPVFDVVINHFAGSDDKAHIVASALFALSLSVRQKEVREVILVDGSPEPDPHLRGEVERMGGRYHHEGRRLSFAEGYNAGAALTGADWIVLSASDVYPSLDFFEKAAAFIARTDADEIGCIVPRLTHSDLPTQTSRLKRKEVCVIPVMTLNLNILQRKVFFEIGGVPEHFSGAFNDVEMAIRLHGAGRRIFMLPDVCTHYGSLTIAAPGTSYRWTKDLATFRERHPAFALDEGFWAMDVSKLSGGPAALALRLATRLSPARFRGRALGRVMSALPLLAPIRRR